MDRLGHDDGGNDDGGNGTASSHPRGTVLLMRHGTSVANVGGWTAGWQDVDLAPRGEQEARSAARAVLGSDLPVEIVYSSLLTRAGRTAEIVAEGIGLARHAVRRRWRLNERHAGAFEGMTREEMVAHAGRTALRSWKRLPDVRPPELDPADDRHPRHDPRYAGLPTGALPGGESSDDVLRRLLPLWEGEVRHELAAGRSVLVVTHEHVLRVLMAHLTGAGSSLPPKAPVPGRLPWALRLGPDGGSLVSARELHTRPG